MLSPYVAPAAAARGRLVARVLDHMDARGVVRGECESRVLESALTLRLLQGLGTHRRACERLLGYLERQRTQCTDPILQRIVAAALGQDPGPRPHPSPSDSEHLRSRRKQILMAIVLGLAAGRIPDLGLESGDFEPEQPIQSWVRTMMQALEVLYLVARGRSHQVTDAHLTTLLAVTDPADPAAGEQYVLGSVLALMALAQLPGRAQLARLRVYHLLQHQRPDGGIPFIARMDVFASATAGLGLVGTLEDRRTLFPTGDFIASLQAADGGWGYATGVTQTDVDDTSYCMQLLRRLDPARYRDPLQQGERYLHAMQNADGGFPTFTRGGRSEITMTAAAINALAPSKARHRGLVRAGTRYILDHQRADGTFERSWSGAHANAIFRALRAIRCGAEGTLASRGEAAQRNAVGYLRRSQNDDGGWGHRDGDASDPMSSACSLIALAHREAQLPITRGIDYLLAQQHSHGGYLSRPDALGPRPFAYDVPVLAQSFVLMALDQVLTRPATASLRRQAA